MGVTLPKTLANNNSLVGIMRMPKCSYSETLITVPVLVKEGKSWKTYKQRIPICPTLIGNLNQEKAVNIPKSTVTDFFPYTYYVLSDGECEPLILLPQYMETSSTFKGIYALSHQPVERYFCKNYRGDSEGRVYNITNTTQVLLPTANNSGTAFITANATNLNQSRNSNLTNVGLNMLNSAVGLGGAFFTGGASLGMTLNSVGSIVGGINNIKENIAKSTDNALIPDTISSFGTPSTREKFKTNNVRLIKYTVANDKKIQIQSFYNKYGYKQNKYIDKFTMVNQSGFISLTGGTYLKGIDNSFLTIIQNIFERGVIFE